MNVTASEVALSFGSFVAGLRRLRVAHARSRTAPPPSFTAHVDLAVPSLITATDVGISVDVDTHPTPARTSASRCRSLEAGALTVGTDLGQLWGTFLFEHDTDGTFVAMTGVGAKIGGQTVLTDGEGAFAIFTDGVAGYVSGTAQLTGYGVAVGGKVLLRVNTTGHAVDRTLTVGGRELAIRFGESEGTVFAISISNAAININDTVFVEGSVAFDTPATSPARPARLRRRRPADAGERRSQPACARRRVARRDDRRRQGRRRLRRRRARHGRARRLRRHHGSGNGARPREHLRRRGRTRC